MWKITPFISELFRGAAIPSAGNVGPSQASEEAMARAEFNFLPQDKSVERFTECALRHPRLAQSLEDSAEGGGVLLAPYGMERSGYPWLKTFVPIQINPSAFDSINDIEGHPPIILIWRLLQRIEDYRSFLALCFEKLDVGGKLLIVVPNQFTYERRLQLPSRVEPAHLRFYSLASLAQEVEEAINPLEMRVEVATQIEGASFDASDAHDLALLLKKVAPPDWSERLPEADRPVIRRDRPLRVLPADVVNNDFHVIRPDREGFAKIAVLKLDHRGDFLMATDALTVLRERFPQADFTMVCGSWNKSEAEKLKMFKECIPFDFFAEDVSAAPRVVSNDELMASFQNLMQGRSFDLGIDLRMTGDTRRLLRLLDARHKAGFDEGANFPWLDISMNVLSPTVGYKAMQEYFGASRFSTIAGHHNGFDITFADTSGYKINHHLMWGPYVDLPAGNFEIELTFDGHKGKGAIHFDICTEKAKNIIWEGEVDAARDTTPLFIQSQVPLRGVEFRVSAAHIDSHGSFSFRGLKILRSGAFTGVHQREAMALLAHLVALRAKNAFLTSVEQ